MSELFSLENLVALLTLTGLEVVLGIDNIVFIAILAGKLDPSLRAKARRTGLGLAMFMRIALLLAIGWIMRLTAPFFSLLDHGISGRDLILIGGGLFLLAKATYEIHHRLEDPGMHVGQAPARVSFRGVVLQILALDLVFSLDSVITAVGMAQHIAIMIAAVVIAVGIMMAFAGAVVGFIERHPTMKMLALSLSLLIGVVLVADGLGTHIGKGYIYFAMAFSLFVELLNLRVRRGQRLPQGRLPLSFEFQFRAEAFHVERRRSEPEARAREQTAFHVEHFFDEYQQFGRRMNPYRRTWRAIDQTAAGSDQPTAH